ncbi:MAG: hypothetical protein FJZ43_01555 [Candidatus Staskawiczbacteria bacterium]|nr:hypothetical protein [Candidatus Staskawiczbacteria bacterium]
MTEKELILKIQLLKEIKPRENWAVFAKSKIFSSGNASTVPARTNYISALLNVMRIGFNMRIAYSMAVLLIVMSVGTLFFMNGSFSGNDVNVAKNSSASLIAIKDSVEQFKEKSKNLSEAVRMSPENTSVAIKEIKDVANDLTIAIQKDPKLAKEVALDINNNKTYLDISDAGDLKEASNDLYKTIVEQMIKDLEKTSLTNSQEESLLVIKESYNEQNYTSALESILLLNSAINQDN